VDELIGVWYKSHQARELAGAVAYNLSEWQKTRKQHPARMVFLYNIVMSRGASNACTSIHSMVFDGRR
jgi:hypothetical protein